MVSPLPKRKVYCEPLSRSTPRGVVVELPGAMHCTRGVGMRFAAARQPQEALPESIGLLRVLCTLILPVHSFWKFISKN